MNPLDVVCGFVNKATQRQGKQVFGRILQLLAAEYQVRIIVVLTDDYGALIHA